ncbi:Octanoyltransferase [bacterium HR24]|nr:Octanoyltransferase [bacterium HR24]
MPAERWRPSAAPEAVLEAAWLGRVPYDAAWALQRQLLAARQEGRCPDTLLLLEHPPVYTCGRSTAPGQLVTPPSALPAPVYEVDRGGGVTFHGPGQVVAYLVMDLRAWRPDVHAYLRALEEVALRVLARYGLRGQRIEGLTGVWLGGEKVAAIGVKVSRWCTMHGLSLNVAVDAGWYRPIVPCGIVGRGVTSLHRHLQPCPGLEEVALTIAQECGAVFGRDVRYRRASEKTALTGLPGQVLAAEHGHPRSGRP